MSLRALLSVLIAIAAALTSASAAIAQGHKAASLPPLKVSENKRFLVTSDGKPFFYVGDTAWELFHRLNREEADRYLEKRAKQGFTVIQAVAIAEFDGLTVPNAYGDVPFDGLDPARPNKNYWTHVDLHRRQS